MRFSWARRIERAGLREGAAATEQEIMKRKLARSGDGAKTVAARLHIGRDGLITVMTGKVESAP